MSNISDLLNNSMPDQSDTKALSDEKPKTHHRQTSITSPLEALAINGATNMSDTREEISALSDKGDSITEQASDKGLTIDKTSTLPDEAQKFIKTEGIASIDTEGPAETDTDLKADGLTRESTAQPLTQIKKEESQGPASIRGASPSSNMPAKGPSKKKSTPGGPKRPSAKKRKLDNRADTPQSQRSGTPNSTLGGRSGPKIKKQSSATPLHSSPGLEDEEDASDASDDGLYCICRKGDDHTWMIGCDGGCDDWFHGRCIGIDQRDGNLIDRFICPNCSESQGAETTWKTMCRLDGCREPAAITAPRPSKYCCDDHAVQFFRRFIKKGLGAENITAAKKRRKDNLTDNFQNYGEEYDKPTHLRGGLLSPGELKTITDGIQSCKEFRSLGESVPVVDEPKPEGDSMDLDKHEDNRYTTQESEQLEKTISRTEQLRSQLKSLEDRERLLALIKTRAKSVCEEFKKKDKSMKDMCGFDRRLRWSNEEFDRWRNSEEGIEAFRSNKLLPDQQVDADGDANMADADELGKGLCLRKRCKQHEGWFKLHSLEFAYSKSDASRELARLANEEQGIRERATLRQLEAKAGEASVDGYS